MDPYFQNQSCDPFTDSSVPCLLGNLPPYFVNVSSAQDVLAGITFAKEKNIRLVVQNTGHDLLGKSAGQGALGLWEHPLKSTEIIQSYDSSSYRGPAMRIGAGVLAGEALAAAHKHGFRVVGGSAASVGLAGGYSQGGGHSLLSSAHGLGADNVLEWEVVTPAGQHLTASPAENQDLYWALCGGGGGTYGVVLSMTLILHPDGPVGGAHLAFQAADVGYDNYWKAINFFHASLPAIVDSGGAILYQFDNESFTTISVAAPGQDEAQVAELLRPLIKGLKELKMPHTFAPSFSSDFYTHFSAVLGPLPYGVFPVSYMSSSRLIPRSAVVDRPGDVSAALQTAVKSGSFTLGCLALNANRTQHPDNAVLPAWREALLQVSTCYLAKARAAELTLSLTVHPPQSMGLDAPAVRDGGAPPRDDRGPDTGAGGRHARVGHVSQRGRLPAAELAVRVLRGQLRASARDQEEIRPRRTAVRCYGGGE